MFTEKKRRFSCTAVFRLLVLLGVFALIVMGTPGKALQAAEVVTTPDGFVLEKCNTIYISPGYELIGYTGQANDIAIPDYYDGIPVISIGKEAFMDNKTLTSVKFPETVYALGTRAFKGCSSLKSVEFLGDCRDFLAENSKSTSLPFHIKLCEGVFYDCTALEYLEFPYGWDTVASDDAYFRGSGIRKLKLVMGVGSNMGKHFNGMPELEQIDIDYNFDTQWYTALQLSYLDEMPKLKVINIYNYDSHSRFDLGLAYSSQFDYQITKCEALKEINVYFSEASVGRSVEAIGNIQNISSDETVVKPSDNKVSGYPVMILSTGCATLTSAESSFNLNFIIGECGGNKKNLADAKVSLPVDSFNYRNDEIKPYAVLTYEKQVLVPGIDYICEYKDNKEIGVAQITFIGTGEYSGENTAEFSIVPPSSNLETAVFSGKKCNLTWNKSSFADGYQVYYSSKKSKGYKKLYSGTDTSLETKNVKSGTYIKIRTYKKIGKKTYYSEWSAPVQVK